MMCCALHQISTNVAQERSAAVAWPMLTTAVSNRPSTWMLDGKQYLIVGAGDTLYALTLAGGR